MPTLQPTAGHASLRILRIIPHFLLWYYRDHSLQILKRYVEYALAFRESFSIIFLVRTLFSPWKKIQDTYPRKGFDMQAIAEAFFMNVTTRAIGASIRLSSIIIGVVLQIILCMGFAVYLLFWLVFPVIVFVLPFYLVGSFFA